MRHFRSSDFCGREELLLVWTLIFIPSKILYMHSNIYNTEGKEKTTQYNNDKVSFDAQRTSYADL